MIRHFNRTLLLTLVWTAALCAEEARLPQLVDQQTLKLEYSEKQQIQESGPPSAGGDGMVGKMNRVAAEINAAGVKVTVHERLAHSEVRVEAYLQRRPDGPWMVTLKVDEPVVQLHPDISARGVLERENTLLVEGLREWFHNLSQAETQVLQAAGEVRVPVSEPLAVLKKWSRPELTLHVRYDVPSVLPREVKTAQGGRWPDEGP